MIPAGQIVENILRAANRTTSQEKRAEVWKALNTMYFQLCREHPFAALRASIDVDFRGTDGTGMWLPSNLFGIRRVYDMTNGVEFIPIDSSESDPEEGGYRYYTSVGADNDLFYSSDASVEKGENVLECDELTSDLTGEYITIGSEFGFYELTAAKAFTPIYYGPTIDGREIRIRPRDTEKLFIIDSSEAVLTDRKVKVHYWKAPQPLYRDSDLPCIPSSDVLELMILQVTPEAKSRRPVSQADVDEAKKTAKMLNPDNPRSARPRDIHNRKFTLTRSAYGRR
jgi:hypothetical protein